MDPTSNISVHLNENQPFRITITCSSVANCRATASIPNVPELSHINYYMMIYEYDAKIQTSNEYEEYFAYPGIIATL